MIKIIAAFSTAAFLFGATVGAQLTFRYYNLRGMKQEIAALKNDRARYRKALGFNTGLEDADSKVEISNQEIVNAILAAGKADPVKCDAPGIVLDPQRLRDIGRLR